MAKKTIEDFIAKENKDKPFQERAEAFMKQIDPICKELGVIPWANLNITEEGIIALPGLKDVWATSAG